MKSGVVGLERWRFGDSVAPLREHLTAGGVLAIPSESSYGLACDPRHAGGVEAIYRLKSRDRGKPLPIVAADLEQLEMLGIDTAAAALRAVAARWPAALSVVVPFPSQLAWPAAAGSATLAVRVPAHTGLRRLIAAVGFPMTATSANSSGDPPILDPDELAAWFNSKVDSQTNFQLILVDAGSLSGGAPSTLVTATATKWRILRPGRVAASALPSIFKD